MAKCAGFGSRGPGLRTLFLVFSTPHDAFRQYVLQGGRSLRVLLIANTGNANAYGAAWHEVETPFSVASASGVQEEVRRGASALRLGEDPSDEGQTSLAAEAQACASSDILVLLHGRSFPAPLVLSCCRSFETIELWNLIDTRLAASGYHRPAVVMSVLVCADEDGQNEADDDAGPVLRPLASFKTEDLPFSTYPGTEAAVLDVFLQPWLCALDMPESALPALDGLVAVRCKSTPGSSHFEALAGALLEVASAPASPAKEASASPVTLRVVGLLADGKGFVVQLPAEQSLSAHDHRRVLGALSTGSVHKASDEVRVHEKGICSVLAQLPEQALHFYFLTTTSVREMLKLLTAHLDLDEETEKCQVFWNEVSGCEVHVDPEQNPSLATIFPENRARLVFSDGKMRQAIGPCATHD
jgi:hypothetical protein